MRKSRVVDRSAERAKKAIEMIRHHNATWKDLEENLAHRTTLEADIARHYTKSGGRSSTRYKKILQMQRANARSRKGKGEIHLIETGYILAKGIEGTTEVVKNFRKVAMPIFCHQELYLLAKRNAVAEWFISPKSYGIVVPYVFPSKEEDKIHLVEPTVPMKPRTTEIVSYALALSRKAKVILHTNSFQVKALVEVQDNRNIEVDYVY